MSLLNLLRFGDNRRSKAEIRAKIQELVDRWFDASESLTHEESEKLRIQTNHYTEALEWILSKTETL